MDAIFTFHSIDDSGSVLSCAPDALRIFVESLLEEGVLITSMSEILRPDPSGRDRASLTFDDGLSSVHRHALPILEDLGVTAMVYVITGWVGQDSSWPTQPCHAPRFELMSWSELHELRASGFEIGCHTVNHPPLLEFDEEQWDLELRSSRETLEDQFGSPVPHFAYPYGIYSESAVQRVRTLYDSAVTTKMGLLGANSNQHLLPRIEMYYLRQPERRRPIFGARTRRYLARRAALRELKATLQGWWS